MDVFKRFWTSRAKCLVSSAGKETNMTDSRHANHLSHPPATSCDPQSGLDRPHPPAWTRYGTSEPRLTFSL